MFLGFHRTVFLAPAAGMVALHDTFSAHDSNVVNRPAVCALARLLAVDCGYLDHALLGRYSLQPQPG
jgi:hypothetical protein